MTALEPAEFVDPPEQPIDLPALAAHTHNKRPNLPEWMRHAGEFRALIIWPTKYGAHTTGSHEISGNLGHRTAGRDQIEHFAPELRRVTLGH